MSSVVRVTVFGALKITDRSGTEIALSARRRAVLAALVVADQPVARRDLVASVGIGSSTLRPLLSRLASDDLGLTVPVHRQIDTRQGLIALDRQLVSSDVGDLRKLLAGPTNEPSLRAIVELGVLAAPVDLGLIADHPLAAALTDELRSLRARAGQAIGRYALSTGRAGDALLATTLRPGLDLPELWLAHIDRQARTDGVESALRSVAEAAAEIKQLEDDGRAVLGVARIVVATAADRQSPTERRPSGNGQRLAGLILDRLAGGEHRVLFVHDPAAGADSIGALLRPVRSRLPAAIGVWQLPGVGAVETLAQSIRPVVADAVRSPHRPLSARLLKTLVAIADGKPLEPDSTARWFARDVASLLRMWSGEDRPLLLVARPTANSPDLDRLLADLLRLDPELRVVVLHTEAAADSATGPAFEAFSRSAIALPWPSTPEDPDSASASASASAADPAVQRTTIDERAAVVVGLARLPDGGVHRGLAAHLLEAVGSIVDLDQVLDTAGHSKLIDASPSATTTGPIAAGELRWLATEGLRWLVAGGLRQNEDVQVLRELVGLVGPRNVPAGLSPELLARASVAVSHGDLERGRALLDVAADTAESARARVEVLVQRGDCCRDGGDWSAALDDYRTAVKILTDEADSELLRADLALRMARLTWDPVVGQEVDVLLLRCLDEIDSDEAVLRARLELCLAGGSFQDGSVGPARLDLAGVESAVDVVRAAFDPGARAWGLIHARKASLGVASVDRSAEWAQEIVDNGVLDIAALAHGHQALFVDNVRRADWPAARRALRRIAQLARTPVSAEQKFSSLVAETCWALAAGEADVAAESLAAAQTYGPQLAGSTFNQVTLGQTVWLAQLQGDQAELAGLAAAAAGLADSEPGGEIWMAGAALLAMEVGRYDEAAERVVEFGRRIGGFDGLRDGAHRLGVLAIAAIVAAHAAAHLGDSPFTIDDMNKIDAGLADTDCAVVLIGWPTVILGPIDRFRGLAAAVLGRYDVARVALNRASDLDRSLAAMADQARRFDALVDQIGRRETPEI